MKLSIWQQFSSNHSAVYQVVGHFKTEQQAQWATEKLKEIVAQIRETNPISESPDANGAYAPTDLEGAIGKEYGFDWTHGIDWVVWKGTWTEIPVATFRNTVWFFCAAS